MIFNQKHIWTLKKHKNTWYILDSLRPSPTRRGSSISSCYNIYNNGLIVPRNKTQLQSDNNALKHCIQNECAALPYNINTYMIRKKLLLGDLHDNLERWVFTRLRILAYLFPSTYQSYHQVWRGIPLDFNKWEDIRILSLYFLTLN